MGRTLVLEVPEDVYGRLAEAARQVGETPEELALKWLETAVSTAEDDPLEKLIGAFASNIPDWADEHDKYIGQALMEKLRDERDEGN